MFQKYLVTGATGFLGRAVLNALRGKKADIYALVLEGDPLASELPREIHTVCGDVCDSSSLNHFFSFADQKTCVIHCAGIVSVASHPGERLYWVNVGGTNNVLRHCERRKVGKLIYVSSVHAIPEKRKGVEIAEQAAFSPDLVSGDYAKSKAIATALVFGAAKEGLNASVVFPSGIIGPGDTAKGSIMSMLLSFLSGRLHLAVKGGYDFVDVRDVASGIVACAEHGLPGRGYILSGQYATVRDILEAAEKAIDIRRVVFYLPIGLAKAVSAAHEKWSIRNQRPLYFTPYAVAVLGSNVRFSRKEAAAALNYTPRPLQNSVRDTILWLENHQRKRRTPHT